jgi:hypothetical protein
VSSGSGSGAGAGAGVGAGAGAPGHSPLGYDTMARCSCFVWHKYILRAK